MFFVLACLHGADGGAAEGGGLGGAWAEGCARGAGGREDGGVQGESGACACVCMCAHVLVFCVHGLCMGMHLSPEKAEGEQGVCAHSMPCASQGEAEDALS